jgi:hypothetical protein
VLTYMTRSVEMEVLPHKGARHSVVERSFVPLDEAHFGGSIAKNKRTMVVNVLVDWNSTTGNNCQSGLSVP